VFARAARGVFERNKRKDDDGIFVEWKGGVRRPIIDVKFPFYLELEKAVLKTTAAYLESIDMQPEMFESLTK
jgi:hypothetical protein